MEKYTYNLHQHNFAAWAAARAAQRGFKGANVRRLKETLEEAGLDKFISDDSNWPSKKSEFDELHSEWCNQIIGITKRLGVENPTYGLAAKLVNIYLKATVVLGPHKDSSLASIVHPPIDGQLLENMAKDHSLDEELRIICKRTKWTKMTARSYKDLIDKLRENDLHKPHFWLLERYWTVTK